MRWALALGRFAARFERQWPYLSRPSMALSVLGMRAKALDATSTISIISHHHLHESTRCFFVLSLHALDSRISQLLLPLAALSHQTASPLSVNARVALRVLVWSPACVSCDRIVAERAISQRIALSGARAKVIYPLV